MNAFGYLRLSHDSARSTSIEKQRASVEQFCASRGWTVVDWFEDVDYSGTNTRRPGLQAMLRRLGEIQGGAVVFHKLDRLMRSARDLWRMREQAAAHDVALISATEGFGEGTLGEMLQTNLAYAGQLEAEQASLRVRATHEHLYRLGHIVGTARAFGWRHDPKKKTWVQVPVEVETIRRMADLYLAGVGPASIARMLHEGELGPCTRSTRGGTWTGGAVTRILQNYRLIGYMTRHGERATDEPTLPPVLSVETFLRLRASFRERTHTRRRSSGSTAVLAGLVFCATCERPMYHHGSEGRRGGPIYGCSTPMRGHRAVVTARILEREVEGRLFEHINEERAAAAEARRVAREVEADDVELRGLVARLEWGREELMRDYYQEKRVDRVDFEAQLEELTGRLDIARAKLETTRDARTLRGDLESWSGVAGEWRGLAPEERRTIFGIWIARVVVHPSAGQGRRRGREHIDVLWR